MRLLLLLFSWVDARGKGGGALVDRFRVSIFEMFNDHE
jgi:hypothetical protein